MPQVPFLSRPLARSFYARPTLDVAPDLLGKMIVRETAGGEVLAARIVEVEAYLGQLDPASHAFRGPKGRAALMYGDPGKLYVYFTYGMHYCMNAVAHDGTHAGAVLLRAAEPVWGFAKMEENRGLPKPRMQLARGPACLTLALGIHREQNGVDLIAGEVRIHPARVAEPVAIGTSVRIGIRQAADKPWRFYARGNPAVSGPRKLNP
jgi:DNA-3-methyladenine glycosylase